MEQADSIARFLAVDDAPQVAFAAIRAIAGAKAPALDGALNDWTQRLDLLAQAGVPVERTRFATALGHAFDYYDGLTLEVRSGALDHNRAVAVGGRYDGLAGRLGGGAGSRAVGCMVRPWRAWAGGES